MARTTNLSRGQERAERWGSAPSPIVRVQPAAASRRRHNNLGRTLYVHAHQHDATMEGRHLLGSNIAVFQLLTRERAGDVAQSFDTMVYQLCCTAAIILNVK